MCVVSILFTLLCVQDIPVYINYGNEVIDFPIPLSVNKMPSLIEVTYMYRCNENLLLTCVKTHVDSHVNLCIKCP